MITRSLMFQLSIIIVFIASGTLAGFGYYRFQIESSDARDQLQEELTTTSERLAISLDSPLYSFHDEGIRDVILSEMNNPDIVGIYIVDPWISGQKYWYSKDTRGNPIVVNEFPDHNSYISKSSPIIHDSEEIGDVIVFISTERMNAQLEANLISIVIQIIVLDILLIIFVIYILRVKVIRPIIKLESGAQEISGGNLNQYIETKGEDEIAQLGQAFNIMTNNLKKSQMEIQNYSKNLEKQVSVRTRELMNSNKELGREITERKCTEVKLNETLKELERSNNELEHFAYVASHDLQEPLRMVSSYVKLLQKRYKGNLDSDADEFIHFAVDGANRMQGLINGLLSYSRVGTKGKPFEPIESEKVFKNATDNLKVSIEESGAIITHDPLPTVIADASQMIQLMQNLIGNGIKFKSDGIPQINISAAKMGNEWQFSVSDNGIGINPKDQERVFQIFQRLHSRDEYLGTGIGLAVCKKIVERHGGRIWVESEPGQGSTFYFTIPNNGGAQP